MRLSGAILGSILVLGAVPASVSAQAYLGEPNSLSTSFSYVYAPSGKVVVSSSDDGSPVSDDQPNVPLKVHVLTLGVGYNLPVPGVAIEASMPLVGVKLGDDSFMHGPLPGEYDDGDSHWSFTDFRGDLKYQIKPIEEYIGLTLGIGASIPVRDYPTNGFAAPGQHLKAFHLGVDIARTLDPILPLMFFQASYDLSLREKLDVSEDTEKINRNMTELSFALGYFLPANFMIDAATDIRLSHGGVDYATLIGESPDVIIYHDQLLDEDNATVGGDLGYAINEQTSVTASARFFVWGQNTRNHNLFGINLEYSFF